MTKEEIIASSGEIFNRFTETCSNIPEAAFFKRPPGKWSVAEHLQHLVISTNTTTLAYRLPRFAVKLIGGTPNRDPKTFDELKSKYYKRLEEGAKASARFIPRPIEIKYGKERSLRNWTKATAKYLASLTNKRTEKDLDNYLVKHPLLGRITLRELCYFTIFHTGHHLQSIGKSINH